MMDETCDECGAKREPGTPDYSPMRLLAGENPGWYSGEDATLCGKDMLDLFNKANGIK